MTSDELIEGVLALARHASEMTEAQETALRAKCLMLEADAREEAARAIAADPARRGQLRPAAPFPLEVEDGAADLSELEGEPSRLLLEFFDKADVRDQETGLRLTCVARSRYDLDLSAFFGWYAFEGRALVARVKDGGAGEFTGVLLLSANHVPALAAWPASAAPALVATLCALATAAKEEKKGAKR